MELHKQIGLNAKCLRIIQKMTIADVADKTGLSRGELSELENGLHDMKASTIARLARGLNVSAMTLITIRFDDCLMCDGNDPDCSLCGGTGHVQMVDKGMQVQE